MPYLNGVILETLRLFPVLSFLDRECQPPNGETHYSLEPYSTFKVPRGMPVYIPAFGLHKDPEVRRQSFNVSSPSYSSFFFFSFSQSLKFLIQNGSRSQMERATTNTPSYRLEWGQGSASVCISSFFSLFSQF